MNRTFDEFFGDRSCAWLRILFVQQSHRVVDKGLRLFLQIREKEFSFVLLVVGMGVMEGVEVARAFAEAGGPS